MNKDDAFTHFRYATDLIDFIAQYGGFYTCASAYPEGHPFSRSAEEDMTYLKMKQDKGVQRFNTQMCFDSDAVLDFINNARRCGITVPFSIGIMPILNPQQILRMVTLAGTSIPSNMVKAVRAVRERTGNLP